MRVSIAAALCLPLALTGCTMTNTGTPSPVQGAELRGSVHGGQQPISGAHVYLFAANTTGYGNASVSLLNSASTGHSDSVGAYVLTDGGGNFNISGDYSCTPNTQVYAYALGGNASFGTNNAAGLLAALGNCPSAANFQGTVSFINMNEVTTVATAFAMAGFATDATHVSSSGTALAQTGIKNAFANAANLANLASGAAATSTAGGNGTPPTNEINTLGDVLAACINSNGAVTGPTNPTGCYTLFTNTLSGGTTGTQPTDTATAAINIAHNPGANVTALYNLPVAQAPFVPILASVPNDWTVGIEFNEGSSDCTTGVCEPQAIAVDSTGNVWAANNGFLVGTVAELGPDGSRKSPALGYSDGTSAQFNSIAVDLNGNVWTPSFQSNCLVEFSGADGSVLTSPGGITGGGLNGPQAIAIDGSDDLWIANKSGNSVSEYSVGVTLGSGTWLSSSSGYTGGQLSTPLGIAADRNGNAWITDNSSSYVTEERAGAGGATPNFVNPLTGGLNTPYGIAIDASGNLWIASDANGAPNITELSSTGGSVSGPFGYGSGLNTGGIDSPLSIAIDGAGNVWLGNQSATQIVEFDNSGNAISPNTGYVAPGIVAKTNSIAVDGSGDVWLADPNAPNYLVELVGAAAPVVTPLSVATKNNTLGTRP